MIMSTRVKFMLINTMAILYGKSNVFIGFFLKKRLHENAGWQLGWQVIPNSLIRLSLVQVLEVSHHKAMSAKI